MGKRIELGHVYRSKGAGTGSATKPVAPTGKVAAGARVAAKAAPKPVVKTAAAVYPPKASTGHEAAGAELARIREQGRLRAAAYRARKREEGFGEG